MLLLFSPENIHLVVEGPNYNIVCAVPSIEIRSAATHAHPRYRFLIKGLTLGTSSRTNCPQKRTEPQKVAH